MNYITEYLEDLDRVIYNLPIGNFLDRKTILITGATGMICSCVADILLRMGTSKVLLAGRSKERIEERFLPYRNGIDYHFVQYDSTKAIDKKINTDFIIHGASNAYPAVYVTQPVETMLSNILGLNELLKMASETDVKRVVYISSSEVYGIRKEGGPFSEEKYGYLDILNSRAAYPSAKRAAETLCIAYGNEYDINTTIVRPGHIYGPTITHGDNRATAEFTRNAVNGENIVMKSAGSQLRSYCYVLDCASAILTVLVHGKRNNAYNVSNPDSVVTIRQIAEAIANSAGTNVIFSEPDAKEAKGYNLMQDSSLIATKLISLGWNPIFNLEDGTRKTVNLLKQKKMRNCYGGTC